MLFILPNTLLTISMIGNFFLFSLWKVGLQCRQTWNPVAWWPVQYFQWSWQQQIHTGPHATKAEISQRDDKLSQYEAILKLPVYLE